MDCIGKKEWALLCIGLAAVIIIALILLGMLLICIVWPKVVHTINLSAEHGYQSGKGDFIITPPTIVHRHDTIALLALIIPDRESGDISKSNFTG